jgi:hypothetical protein
MSRLFSMKSFGLSILAAALAVAFTPSAFAQTDAAVVKTVPAIGAPALITGNVDESKLATLGARPVPSTAKDLGPASGNTKMGMQLVLRRSPQQEQALMLLNQQAVQPGTPHYGRVMTSAEFAETFGLAASDLATLKGQLESAGFTVGNVGQRTPRD